MSYYREAADKVVKGSGKFEELVVCSQEIAASTTQLVVSSKVKAPRGSTNLPLLAEASRNVTAATGKVVASAKSAAQMIEDLGMFVLTAFRLVALARVITLQFLDYWLHFVLVLFT